MLLIIVQITVPVLIAYFLGSIPTAVWVGRRFYGVDVRKEGSGNAGATNTIRVLGLKAGIPVLVIDILKGLAAVLLTPVLFHWLGGAEVSPYLMLTAAAAVVLGHTFPVFAGFKGGKGVATLLGVGFGLYPLAAVGAVVIFASVLIISGYVSLGSITAGIAFPLMVIFLFPPSHVIYVVLSIAVALFLPVTHRKNIKRLLNGTESKFRPGKSSRPKP